MFALIDLSGVKNDLFFMNNFIKYFIKIIVKTEYISNNMLSFYC